jgi:hypothetical protein
LTESIPTYPLELEKSGYHTGYTYKVWRVAAPQYGDDRNRYETAGTNYKHFSHRATERVEELGVEGAKQALNNETRDNFNSFLDARPKGNIPAGRTINDFVNLMDLAPTFLEAMDVPIPNSMTGKSLLPVLKSEKSGQVDPDRTFVITGRERHVATSREGKLPYPQRAIRIKDFLYIHNFAPDRWPMGDPQGLDDLNAEAPSAEDLTWNTRVAYPDLDASPTKA